MANNSIEWRDNTPVSTVFDDLYYSADDGLAESRHVFLTNNHLPQAWQTSTPKNFTVLETGFGTGLNFCATALLWKTQAQAHQTLHFVSVEKHPLGPEQIIQALSRWPELKTIGTELCHLLPPSINGWHQLSFPTWQIELTLIYDDISTALPQIAANDIRADTIFLDGFAPAKNPEMWTDTVLEQLAQCANNKATLATFTAVGRVRRSLQNAGFTMGKTQGFGRKREMLVGTYNPEKQPQTKAWYKLKQTPPPQTVAVVGAGIAGSIIAYKLAERGIQVNVYEQANTIASAASGNPQGVLFIKLSAADGMLSTLSLASFLYAQRFYQQLLDSKKLESSSTQLTGMLQLLNDSNWQKLQHAYNEHPDLVQFVSAAEASSIAGTRVRQKAAYFPNSGWIAPATLCKHLLQHPNISLHTDTPIRSIQTTQQGCLLISDGAQYQADAIVLATALASQSLLSDMQLPIKSAPGQVSSFNAEASHHAINCVVCHEGYIAPPLEGTVTIGATFRTKATSLDETQSDHQQNLQAYRAAFPDLPLPSTYTGRVSCRTTTNDYLPITGPVANTTQFADTFAALGHDASQEIKQNGCYEPNLYILTGLGSRGLSYAPLAAELLCQQILAEPIRLAPPLAQALNPARFIIRALKRGKLNAL